MVQESKLSLHILLRRKIIIVIIIEKQSELIFTKDLIKETDPGSRLFSLNLEHLENVVVFFFYSLIYRYECCYPSYLM